MTEQQIDEILEALYLPSMYAHVKANYVLDGVDGGGWLMGLSYVLPCNVSGVAGRQYGRKFYIPPDANTSAVIKTAMDAYTAFWLHEMRERVKYKGARIFDPHLYLNHLNEDHHEQAA